MDDKEKILCGCGVVFFSAAAERDGTWILSETCPGCDHKDNSPEVLSIDKVGRKRAAAVIGAICDLLESDPVHALNGQVDRRIREVAQHLEDLGRPTAAARISKGWSALKGGLLKGAASHIQGRPALSDYLPVQPAKGKAVAQLVGMGMPACIFCHAAVTDYEKHHDKVDELICPKCRSVASGPEVMAALESEVARRETALVNLGRRCAALKNRLAEMKTAKAGGT